MDDSHNKPESKVKKIKKNRCAVCNKKVGLLGFTCPCSNSLVFCSAHRLPEEHKCSYDHKSQALNILESKLVKVNAEKIIKI